MAQQPGMGNTAPYPIAPGNNPSGVNMGLPQAQPGGFPQAWGPTPGAIPTTGGPGGFPANGVTGTGSGMPSLSSGSGGSMTPQQQHDLSYALDKDYGTGVGAMLTNMLQNGLYNPQVAQALIAAMQPQINRGLEATTSAFGAEGARFSSSAQIGVGDYESQAVLGENQVLANLYQQDQMAQLSLLENILPTRNKEQDNSQKSGVLDDILGGAEIAGGIAAEFIPGGQIAGGALISGGVGTIAGQGKSAASRPTGSPMAMPMSLPGANGVTPSWNPNSSTGQAYQQEEDMWQQMQLSTSAGSQVGGASSSGTSLEQMLMDMGLNN